MWRFWCWEGLGAGEEGDNGGWDGWMASPTRWTWVWVNSRSWWWTGRPGVLWSMGLQRVGHDLATEMNRTELMWSTDSLGKTLMLEKIEGRRRRGWQDEMVGWHHRLSGHGFGWTLGADDGQGSSCAAVHGVAKRWTQLNWACLWDSRRAVVDRDSTLKSTGKISHGSSSKKSQQFERSLISPSCCS